MTYHVRDPRPPLSEFVDHLWQFADYSVPVSAGHLFADGCGDLMWNLSAPLRLVRGEAKTTWRDGWVSGQRTQPIVIELESRCFTMVGVRFRPGGLPALLGAPADGLGDDVVDLREFWRSAAREVHGRLAEANGVDERFDVLERELRRRIVPHRRPRDGLTELASRVLTEPGRFSIARVERQLDVSYRHLGRLFSAQVGMSPKAFQRVARFRSLLRALVGVERPDWASLAVEVGYSDQPHLCREFRAFTGMTPSRFRMPTPLPDYMPWADRRLIDPADR